MPDIPSGPGPANTATDSTSSSAAPIPEGPSLASSVQTNAPGEKVTPPATAGSPATPAAKPSDTAQVLNDAQPDASGKVPDKAKPAEAAPATEGKAAQTAKPDPNAPAAKAEDEVVVGKDEILSADEISQKFPSSNKGLRAYASSLGERLNAATETLNIVENLGGKEGIDLLLELGDVLANPKATDKFETMLEKFPWHRKAFANKVFWKEAENDKPGGSLDLLVKEISEKRFNKEMSLEDVLTAMSAVASGEIDLETLREKAELKLTASERAERDRKAAEDKDKDERLTAAERKIADKEAEDKADNLEKTYASVTAAAEVKWKPIAERLKMLPDKEDPPAIAQFKTQHLYRLLRDVDDRLKADPDYEALIALAQNGQAETTAFKMKNAVVANKSGRFFEEVAKAAAPFFTAAISGHNGKEIANIKNAPSEPSGAPSIAAPANVKPDASGVIADPEARRVAFLETMKRELANAGGATG